MQLGDGPEVLGRSGHAIPAHEGPLRLQSELCGDGGEMVRVQVRQGCGVTVMETGADRPRLLSVEDPYGCCAECELRGKGGSAGPVSRLLTILWRW